MVAIYWYYYTFILHFNTSTLTFPHPNLAKSQMKLNDSNILLEIPEVNNMDVVGK